MPSLETPIPTPTKSDLHSARDVLQRLKGRLTHAVRGRDDVIDLLLVALMADGHVLLEDFPGSGKTTLAKALGESITPAHQETRLASFRRVQFTPDLLPSDITGVSIFEPESGKFHFQPGPLFAYILLADEINRTSPKVQAAMLESMAEKQVTADNVTHPLDDLFFVIATQNPRDQVGTFPLPVAQLDRFLFKIVMAHQPELAQITPELLFVLAEFAQRDDRMADAESLLRTALDVEPRFWQAANNLGIMMLQRERVEEAVHSLDRRVLGRDARLHGPLRLTTFDALAVRHVALFKGFQRRYPDIELEISVENAPVSLTRREADVALRLTNSPPEHLVGRKILRAEFALYAHRDLVAEHGDNLGGYPWLAWDERLGARLTQEWMDANVPEARIAAVIDSSALMIRSVQRGFGIQFLICPEGDGRPELVRLRPPEPGFGMDLWVLTHPDLRGTARVKAFMDHLYDGLREHAEAYAGDASA